MEQINIWQLNKVYIKPKYIFLKKINLSITNIFKNKLKFYNELDMDTPFLTFKNLLKYSYYKKEYYASLEVFIKICEKLKIPKEELQDNIESYKSARGHNIIKNPILPIKITPIFDMLLAHNIGDGTVINPKRGRQIYFGYRQFDKFFRLLYVKKIESIFGKIEYKERYFNKSTRPYCPAVLSSSFFNYYNLNSKSFLSKKARLPDRILNKNNEYLLAVLLAFIIDEGSVDSTLISIRLKNIRLIKDLEIICKKLSYNCTVKYKGENGSLYIKRDGMKKLFLDYKKLVKIYPVVSLGKWHEKILNSFKIYNRQIYKIKGNRNIILDILKSQSLSVNKISEMVNMTRQGVRYHIHNLEKLKEIDKYELSKKNIVYSYRRR